MKLTYDTRYNIAYLMLHEKQAEVETIKVSDELNVDIAPDGTIYGIELLNANDQLLKEEFRKTACYKRGNRKEGRSKFIGFFNNEENFGINTCRVEKNRMEGFKGTSWNCGGAKISPAIRKGRGRLYKAPEGSF